MKNILILTLFSLVFLPFSVWAVKAKPGLVEYTEADGNIVKIQLNGDEKFNYALSEDGYLILLNEHGCFEYAVKGTSGQPVLSGVRTAASIYNVSGELIKGQNLKDIKPEIRKNMVSSRFSKSGDSLKYRYSTSAFPTLGQPHSLVILVEYPDYGFNVENPKNYYEDFLNGEDFKEDGATGSCKKFYRDNSKGAFDPTFDVYGPVMLKQNRRYYGGGSEINAYMMVVEAVEALDDEVDFSVYDHNDDGYVDSVYIIYADKGQADGGPAETVWPYSWELEEEGVNLVADGVKFNTYGCSNELQNDGEMDGIGIFVHEFGHVLGLPDLYNTDNSYDITTPNEWSIMDSGSYNNDSRTPCNFSSFERYSLGWLSPVEIVADGIYSLGNLGDRNEAYIMTTEENEDEFFIAEYRLLTGWDKYMPEQGMLVWHIEFNQLAWDWNTVNNDSKHPYVYLVRADNAAGFSSLKSDPFPGSKKIRELSFETSPSLRSWAGERLNVLAIKDIYENEEESRVYFNAEVNEFRGDANVEEIIPEMEIIVSGNIISISQGIFPVYDLAGRKVGILHPDKPLSLEKGVYIVKGKKILIG